MEGPTQKLFWLDENLEDIDRELIGKYAELR
jgi:hypothetical protein